MKENYGNLASLQNLEKINERNFTVEQLLNENLKNEDGESEADFISVVAWEKRAETICKYVKKGNRLGDICHAIGEYVHSQGYSVVREFQGHGIGREMHEDPGIPNYGKAGRGIRLEPGMTLAIEPMVIQGKPNILELDDGWTIITEDGSMAAHYENTILITEKEPEILTILKK